MDPPIVTFVTRVSTVSRTACITESRAQHAHQKISDEGSTIPRVGYVLSVTCLLTYVLKRRRMQLTHTRSYYHIYYSVYTHTYAHMPPVFSSRTSAHTHTYACTYMQVFHPNVWANEDSRFGKVCLDVLDDKWSPALRLQKVRGGVHRSTT
jgi:hypothetical protein